MAKTEIRINYTGDLLLQIKAIVIQLMFRYCFVFSFFSSLKLLLCHSVNKKPYLQIIYNLL